MSFTDDPPQPDEGLASEIWLAAQVWDKTWDERRAKPPDTLYHYTDAAGLLGIVQTAELWASNAAFLNDASELVHVHSVLDEVASELADEYEDLIVGEFLRIVVDEFGRLYIQGMEVFVVCFCEFPDLLSQWRAYPASSGGYAIGFDSKVIAAGRFLLPIMYDEEAQRRTIRSLLVTHCDLLPRAAEESDSYRRKCLVLAVRMAAASLADCAFAFKHPSFASECEWRLVRVMMRDRVPPYGGTPNFRVRGGRLVPYTPMGLGSRDGRQSMREVVVGPGSHSDLAVGAARSLLLAAGYDGVANMVMRSAVPLRV